jgi:hypothetical protein
VVLLYLAPEDSAQAANVYQHIQASPLISKAQFFNDAIYRFLPPDVISSPLMGTPREPDLSQDLWATAASVVSSWVQIWMEEHESINTQKDELL